MSDPYEHAYYSGIVWERRAKAQLHRGGLGLGPQVYGSLREAMTWYERAEAIRPAGNDDPLLRWNTCARVDHAGSPPGAGLPRSEGSRCFSNRTE